MINKIIVSFFFVELLVAVALSLYGITHVELSTPFMSFLTSCNEELNNFRVEIPNIPSIPIEDFVPMPEADNPIMWNILLWLATGIFTFLNGLVSVLNFLLIAINTLISLLQFVFIVLKNFITMKNTIVDNASISAIMFIQSI